jgi:branched-subunit amino acid ABC-type transport system permease component
MADFLQTLLSTLILGSLFALIALGYTMVYGVLKLINFAHSDIVALGAWVSLFAAATVLGFIGIDVNAAPWYSAGIVLAVAMVTCGGLGFAVERLAYKPIRKAPRLNALITAIGVSLLLQNAGQLQFNVWPNEKSIAKGDTTARAPGKPAASMTFPIALNLESGYDYKVKIKPKPAAGEAPTTAPTDDADDRATVRMITTRPGEIAAGGEVTLDSAIGNSLLRTGQFELIRVAHRPAVRLPFGAKPASMPPIVPIDSGETVALGRHPDGVMPKVEWLPSKAVVVQFNFFSDGPTRDGVASSIYKPVKISTIDCVIFATAMLLMTALQFLIFKTRLGTAMRAVSYNMDTAALMGIPVDRIVSTTFVVGTMLAAAAGFLYSLKYNPIYQTADSTWTLLGLKAFIAAVVGGIGNIRGAAVGGFLIAFIDQFSAYFGAQIGWDRASALTDVWVFLLLIGVLLFKPTGLFGSTVREKV